MIKDYGLECYSEPYQLGNETFVDEFADIAERVKATKRRMGGYWDLSFMIPIEKKDGYVIGRDVLEDWFNNRMMFVVQQKIGGLVVWDGVVWRMDLSLDGITYRRDMGEVFNAIQTQYVDPDGLDGTTSWYTDDQSMARYGRREQIILLRNVSATVAATEAQTMLSETAEPWERPIAIDRDKPDQIVVQVVGRIFTANNKYVGASTLNGTTSDLDVVVKAVVDNDCEFMTSGIMSPNAISYKRSLDQPIRAWDFLLELTEIGDGSDPWLTWCSNWGLTHYQKADNEPHFYWMGRDLGFTTREMEKGAVTGWSAWPSVIRNMTRPGGDPVPGSGLQDRRDSWIEEIVMADGLDDPQIRPGDDDDDLDRAMQRFRIWTEMEDTAYYSGARPGRNERQENV